MKVSLLTHVFTSYSGADLGFVGPEAYTIWDIFFKENNTKLEINCEYLEWEKESQQNIIF